MSENISIEKFIPSETFRNYLKENGIELSPIQKVKLIHESDKPILEKMSAYKDLISSDNIDKALREQLETVVSYTESFVEKELSEKDGAVYKLEILEKCCDKYDWDELGTFASIRDAERIGSKCGCKFRITRQFPMKPTEEELSRLEKEAEEKGYICIDEQAFWYNSDGQLKCLDRMNEIGAEESDEYQNYSDVDWKFNEIFADLPICFENGDIVRSVGIERNDGYYGIIHIPSDYREEIQRIKSLGIVPDDKFRAEFLYEDGVYGHNHYYLWQLEKVELDSVPENQRMSLHCASDLVKGKGCSSIQEFQLFTDALKKK